jgi:hypothetical protein
MPDVRLFSTMVTGAERVKWTLAAPESDAIEVDGSKANSWLSNPPAPWP